MQFLGDCILGATPFILELSAQKVRCESRRQADAHTLISIRNLSLQESYAWEKIETFPV
jgi:hypothetical protein